MKIKSSISLPVYTATVTIPNDVYEMFGHLPCYEQVVVRTTSTALHSGQNSYSEVEEWAEYHSQIEAQAFIDAWELQIEEWRLQWVG